MHFLQMGGYGFYVWTSYGLVLGAMACFIYTPFKRWRHYLKQEKS